MAIKLTDNTKYFEDLIIKKVANACKEIGIVGTTSIKANTPVGVYPTKSGRKGGTLRRNWTFKTANTANKYKITFGNSTDYAPYVEFKPNKSQGFFRATMRDLTEDAINILKKHLKEVE